VAPSDLIKLVILQGDKMKKKIIDAMFWCVMAFLIGAFVAMGNKTIDAVWPDEPTVMKHVVDE
jgi:hypothetical protein